MKNISSLTPSGEQILYFKEFPKDEKAGEISFCVTSGPLMSIPFNKQYLNTNKLEQLKDKVILTDSYMDARTIMLEQVPVSDTFIHAILAHWVLADNAIDYRNTSVTQLNPIKHLPLREFIEITGQENLFFVCDVDLHDYSVLCAEVNRKLPIVYNMAWIKLNQGKVVQWEGEAVPIDDIEEFLTMSTEDFNRSWHEVEIDPLGNNDE